MQDTDRRQPTLTHVLIKQETLGAKQNIRLHPSPKEAADAFVVIQQLPDSR